jgi:hypothetical protein
MTNKHPSSPERTPAGGGKAPGDAAPVRRAAADHDSKTLARVDQGASTGGLFDDLERPAGRGLGPDAGGQSGDTEGLSREELSGPESVEELIEEGQAYEAEVIDGIENVPDADQGEIRTRQVPEDDVPQEYLDKD